MWLKPLIGALGALGLLWIVHLVLFGIIFAATLVALREVAVIVLGHVPSGAVLLLSCVVTFLLLLGLQKLARRRGWGGQAADHSRDW